MEIMPRPPSSLGVVEDSRRETGRHFRVETNLDSGLNLGFAFDDHVEQFVRMSDGLTVVGEQGDQWS